MLQGGRSLEFALGCVDVAPAPTLGDIGALSGEGIQLTLADGGSWPDQDQILTARSAVGFSSRDVWWPEHIGVPARLSTVRL